jgi:hypothetical protein
LAVDYLGSRDLAPAWRQKMSGALSELDETSQIILVKSNVIGWRPHPIQKISGFARLPWRSPPVVMVPQDDVGIFVTQGSQGPQITKGLLPSTIQTQIGKTESRIKTPPPCKVGPSAEVDPFPRIFAAHADEDIRTILSRWSQDAGYFLQPRKPDAPPEPWQITHEDACFGGFIEALYWLRDGFSREPVVPHFALTVDKTVILSSIYR